MNNDWIEWRWTPEKPHPETLETLVMIRLRSGIQSKSIYDVTKVNQWNWFTSGTTNDITHYKLA